MPQYVLDDVYTDVPIKYSESKKNGTSSIVNRENSSPENPGSDYDSQEVVDEGLGSESQIRVDNSQRKVDCDANSQRVVEALRNQRQTGRTGGQCFVCDEAFITGSNHPLFEGSVCSECKVRGLGQQTHCNYMSCLQEILKNKVFLEMPKSVWTRFLKDFHALVLLPFFMTPAQ